MTLSSLSALLTFSARLKSAFTVIASFARLSALSATFGTEAIAATTIAASTEIAVAATVKLPVLFALWKIRIWLVAAAFGRNLALGAFIIRATFFVAFIVWLGVEALAQLRSGHSWLHRAHHAEVMIGVLQIILAQHPISRGGRIARELQVTLVNHRGVTANLHLWAIALHGAVRVVVVVIIAVVVMSTTAARLTTAATLTLHRVCTMCF